VGVVGPQLGLIQLERRLVQGDRFGQPSGFPVGFSEVVAAFERVVLVGAEHAGQAIAS
jgi:hypothetical protein